MLTCGGSVYYNPWSYLRSIFSERKSMRDLWLKFRIGTQGQDLIEYSLLLAFICLAGAATFIGFGTGATFIWTVVNSRVASAAGSSGS